jgi:hypothetical protein
MCIHTLHKGDSNDDDDDDDDNNNNNNVTDPLCTTERILGTAAVHCSRSQMRSVVLHHCSGVIQYLIADDITFFSPVQHDTM